MDEVILKGLRFEGRHGVSDAERAAPQPIEVDLILGLDLRPAGITDSLDRTVDYSLAYQEVRQTVEEESFKLLEALAERIAERVLRLNRVIRADIVVKKLRPPIAGDYEYFAVRLKRERAECRTYIALGTNLGNREENLTTACRLLEELPSSRVVKFSSRYPTLPWGMREQPDFLNQVAMVDTRLSARELLQELMEIEKDMGRRRVEKWGPRIIDLDLLLYGDQQIDEPGLTVPHPELTNRAFVLTPLLEIAPDLKLPDGRYLREILANLS